MGLVGQPYQPWPAALPAAHIAERALDVAVDGAGREALRAARHPLDLPRRQPERLAQVADRPPRAVGGEGRDEGRALVAVALVHPRQQHLAHVAREVEVDVRQRRQLLVEEAPEQELIADRIDVREAGQIADDRRDRGSASAPGGEQRPGGGRPPHLDRHLPRELEQVAVQEEEAGQSERVDHAQLLLQPRAGLGAMARRLAGVAVVQPCRAQLGQAARGVRVLGARVAVAEVVEEVEPQPLRQPPCLGDRLGVLREARGHRLRRGEHVRPVPAPHGLGGIERGVVADGHERVLERRARARVRVDVAGGHAGHAQPGGQAGQCPIARAVVAVEGALQLDQEAVAAERSEQGARRRLVVHPAGGAARQADEPLGVLEHRRERDLRVGGRRTRPTLARMRVRARDQATQVGPAAGALHQERDVTLVVEVELRAVDRPQPESPRGLRELHRARDRVMVGQRQRLVAQLERRRDQLVGHRGPVEEGVGGVAVELDIWRSHTNICSHMGPMDTLGE